MHIDELKLIQYADHPEKVKNRETIEAHLNECAVCRNNLAWFKWLNSVLNDMRQNFDNPEEVRFIAPEGSLERALKKAKERLERKAAPEVLIHPMHHYWQLFKQSIQRTFVPLLDLAYLAAPAAPQAVAYRCETPDAIAGLTLSPHPRRQNDLLIQVYLKASVQRRQIIIELCQHETGAQVFSRKFTLTPKNNWQRVVVPNVIKDIREGLSQLYLKAQDLVGKDIPPEFDEGIMITPKESSQAICKLVKCALALESEAPDLSMLVIERMLTEDWKDELMIFPSPARREIRKDKDLKTQVLRLLQNLIKMLRKEGDRDAVQTAQRLIRHIEKDI